jgi:hypothetical protein
MSVAYQGNYANLTIGAGGSSGSGSGTISITGPGTGYNNSVLTSTGTGASTWANNTGAKLTTKGQMHLEGEDADIVMNGVSLKEILNGITDRLSILQPKPELLAKYENLREAYEHYKTLEALLHEDNNGQ